MLKKLGCSSRAKANEIFVEEHQKHMSVDRLCRILDVTSRGYRSWRSRPVSNRQRQDMILLAHIREQHHLCLGSYGRPRMTQELKEIGLRVGHRRVGRLMRQNGIQVVRTRKYKATTNSNHKFNIAPNWLDRNFAADRQTKNGPLTSAIYGLVKAGSIWP